MRKLALIVASFMVVFVPATQADAKPTHEHHPVAQRAIDWD
jgi:hypothetical protein